MGLRDLKNNLSFFNSLAPAARVAAATGTKVDLQGMKSAAVVFNIGAYTNGNFTLKVQEGDASDGSDLADVAASDLEGSFTDVTGSGQANALQKVGYKGSKRYIAAVIVENSGSPAPATGCVFGAFVVCEPNAKPAA